MNAPTHPLINPDPVATPASKPHRVGSPNHLQGSGENLMVGQFEGYVPVDITPPELRADGLAESVAAGWAEPFLSPEEVSDLPAEVTATAGDDAIGARWWPFGDLDQLAAAVRVAGGRLYEAHRPLLTVALDRLASVEVA